MAILKLATQPLTGANLLITCDTEYMMPVKHGILLSSSFSTAPELQIRESQKEKAKKQTQKQTSISVASPLDQFPGVLYGAFLRELQCKVSVGSIPRCALWPCSVCSHCMMTSRNRRCMIK
jgi:hypothetical protein